MRPFSTRHRSLVGRSYSDNPATSRSCTPNRRTPSADPPAPPRIDCRLAYDLLRQDPRRQRRLRILRPRAKNP